MNFIKIIIILIISNTTFSQKIQQRNIESNSAKLLKIRGLQFKDLNKNNKLDKYEDWRLSSKQRAEDLVTKMTLEEKAGFMLISTTRLKGDWSFQPNAPKEEITSDFNEEDLVQNVNMFSKAPLGTPILSAAGTTKAVNNIHQRHFILRANTKARTIAEWSNKLQALCEASRLGIPAIVASNPRNHLTIDASIGLSVGTTVFSKWPGELGLSAMNDYNLTKEYAEIAAKEWRSVGLRKGYMYMADLATEPRWQRIEGTFGEDADHASKMIKAIVEGFQGKVLNTNSIALTTKHFPGGGPQVKGQDSHFDWGKYAHYPGKMQEFHIKPFIAAIEAGTSSIMPYYSAPKDDAMEPVGFSYNKAIVNELLKGKLGFKGIVNSDTGPIDMMPWGVESLTIPQRYQKALEAGVDLFSGGADPALLIETIKKGMVAESRINESIIKLLIEKFDLGLFENPYVNVDEAEKTVGSVEFQQKADLAHRKSIVLLRNDDKLLPLQPKRKVYFESYYDNGRSKQPIQVIKPTENKWNIEFVNSKEEADLVVLWLKPNIGSLFENNGQDIELQLSKSKIDIARVNETTYHKPTVLIVNYTNPWVIDEVYNPNVKTVLATFNTNYDAVLDVITGKFNPTGKMPFSTPISRKAVIENKSDVPGYMEPGYSLFKFGEGLSY